MLQKRQINVVILIQWKKIIKKEVSLFPQKTPQLFSPLMLWTVMLIFTFSHIKNLLYFSAFTTIVLLHQAKNRTSRIALWMQEILVVGECMCVCIYVWMCLLTKAIKAQRNTCLFVEEGCNADVSSVNGLWRYNSPPNTVTLSVTEGNNYIRSQCSPSQNTTDFQSNEQPLRGPQRKPTISDYTAINGGSAPGDNLYSPDRQRSLGHIDEPQRQISSEDLVT